MWLRNRQCTVFDLGEMYLHDTGKYGIKKELFDCADFDRRIPYRSAKNAPRVTIRRRRRRMGQKKVSQDEEEKEAISTDFSGDKKRRFAAILTILFK